MTQEEKQLLLKDLCARLPYGVQIHIDFNENGHIVADATLDTITSITGQFFNFTDIKQDFKNGDCCPIGGFGSNKLLRLEEFKPYLRPMSSMTDEERKELRGMTIMRPDFLYGMALFRESYKDGQYVDDWDCCSFKILDWLNAHHFDYRGLIKRGLALEATEDMYNLA